MKDRIYERNQPQTTQQDVGDETFSALLAYCNSRSIITTDAENNKVTTSDINLNFKSVDSTTANDTASSTTSSPPKRGGSRYSESSGVSSLTNDTMSTDTDEKIDTMIDNLRATPSTDDGDDTDDDDNSFSHEDHSYGSDDFDLINQSFNDMDLNDVNSNRCADGSNNADNDDDDEQVFKEFNSHQFWYISPDIPVDMDILLEPEEKSTHHFATIQPCNRFDFSTFSLISLPIFFLPFLFSPIK